MRRIVRTEPTRPRRLEPQIPRALERIVLQAIARDPERRYPSARALAADLLRFLNGQPVHACTGGWWGRVLRRWLRKRSTAASERG